MEKKKDKNKTVYTKAKVIKMVARSIRIRTSVVEDVFDGLEQVIFDILSSADEENDTSIRLFDGITLDSEFIPSFEKMNNITGEVNWTKEKIKAKSNITRYYSEKLSKVLAYRNIARRNRR